MAKTKSKNVVAEMCCSAPIGDYKPRMYVSLEGQDVGQIKELAVGDEVELVVKGKVVGLSQRERPNYKDPKKTTKTGDIDLEDYKVLVLDTADNIFEKMAAEEEGETGE